MLSVSQSAMSSSELFSQLICLCFKRDCGIQHPPARIIGSTSCTMDINGHAPYANAQHVQVCTCTSWTCIGSCMLTCVVGADRHKKQARLVVDAQCIKELAYLPHAGSIKLADCCGAYLDPTAPLYVYSDPELIRRLPGTHAGKPRASCSTNENESHAMSGCETLYL